MSRTPPVPRNTCPDIDDVVTGLNKIEKAFDGVDFSGLRHTMETLREANDSLRLNYEHQLERADELDKDLDLIKTAHQDTTDQLAESHKRECELEARIKELEAAAASVTP